MGQITVTIPDSLENFIREIAEDQQRPISQLAAMYLEAGLKAELESLNRIEIYKTLLAKRKIKNPQLTE